MVNFGQTFFLALILITMPLAGCINNDSSVDKPEKAETDFLKKQNMDYHLLEKFLKRFQMPIKIKEKI